jgi:hypothetical protein
MERELEHAFERAFAHAITKSAMHEFPAKPPGETSALVNARRPLVQPNSDSLQEAFQGGYHDFVDAPVKRLESSWSKIGDSLGRMERKLSGLA